MDRAERVGLGVAAVGHVVLFAILSLGLVSTARLPPPTSEPIDVQLVDAIGLRSAAPQSTPEPPAPSEAPEQGPAEDAAPAPSPAPPSPEPPAEKPAEAKVVPPPSKAADDKARKAQEQAAAKAAADRAAAEKAAAQQEEAERAAAAEAAAAKAAAAAAARAAAQKSAAAKAAADRAAAERAAAAKDAAREAAAAKAAAAKAKAAAEKVAADKAAAKAAAAKAAASKAAAAKAKAGLGSVAKTIAEAAKESGEGSKAKPTGSRLGANFLKGIAPDKATGKAATPPAAAVNAQAMAGLAAAIKRQVEPCYELGSLAGTPAMSIVTTLRLRFNKDGSVGSAPTVSDHSGVTSGNQAYVRQIDDVARRAVLRCSPLKLPPELYAGGWEDIELRFIPGQMR